MRYLLVTAAVASATFVAMPPAEAAFVVRDCGGNVIKVDYKKRDIGGKVVARLTKGK